LRFIFISTGGHGLVSNIAHQSSTFIDILSVHIVDKENVIVFATASAILSELNALAGLIITLFKSGNVIFHTVLSE
jgi:hemerythrin-like domain-containing protein